MAETRGARLGGASHDSPAAGAAGGSPKLIYNLSTGCWRVTSGKGQPTASDPWRARQGGWVGFSR